MTLLIIVEVFLLILWIIWLAVVTKIYHREIQIGDIWEYVGPENNIISNSKFAVTDIFRDTIVIVNLSELTQSQNKYIY